MTKKSDNSRFTALVGVETDPKKIDKIAMRIKSLKERDKGSRFVGTPDEFVKIEK